MGWISFFDKTVFHILKKKCQKCGEQKYLSRWILNKNLHFFSTPHHMRT